MDAKVEARLREILGQHQTMVLATESFGQPWAAAVFFAEDFTEQGLRLYLVVNSHSRKIRNLRRNPRVGFTIDPQQPSRFIQGFGTAHPVRDPARAEEARRRIVAKAPAAGWFIENFETTVYEIVPRELKASDFTVGFRPPLELELGGLPGYDGGDRWASVVNRLRLASRLARTSFAWVSFLPVVLGGALAWAHTGNLHAGWFLVAVVGAVAAHLAANVTNDVFDFASGVDELAASRDSRAFGGSGVLTAGMMTPYQARAIAWGLYAVAIACGAVLAYFRGPAVLWMGLLGFVMAYFYVAPPVAFGYVGRGLGELAIFVAFGPLPVLGGYYVQTGRLDWLPVLASLPLAFYTTAILFNHHFTHWEADRQVGKMTPVVVLGESRAIMVAWALILAAYGSVGLNVALGVFPAYALLALATLPVVLRPLLKLRQVRDLYRYMDLTGKTAQANRWTGAVLVGALLLSLLG